MLNISGISEGFVLDHIQAGMSLKIYHDLGLDKLDCQVAIIKNAKSQKMGRKDIIKIESPLDVINLDILGYIDHNITVNIIHNGEISEKKRDIREKESAISIYSTRLSELEEHQECIKVQESTMYHFYRAGTGANLSSYR